ncbi:MAG: HAD family hydrolase [Treponema sp.]|jgi:phosphoglycolate phosphatase|nr:HAD family hydrolase [Treponema sp.]
MKYRCIIFDLDGTLADTIPDIAQAMNRALAEEGFATVDEAAYSAMVGWGIRRLAELALPPSARTEEAVKRIAARAERVYHENPLVRTKVYPGMAGIAGALAEKHIKTAVLSNKPDEVTRSVVNGLFPPGSFGAIRGGRPGIPLKPDPFAVMEILAELDRVPRDTVFAGDSEIDMRTARESGCFPLGVSWGYRPRSVLEEAGAAVIVDSPAALLSFMLEDGFVPHGKSGTGGAP